VPPGCYWHSMHSKILGRMGIVEYTGSAEAAPLRLTEWPATLTAFESRSPGRTCRKNPGKKNLKFESESSWVTARA
jgi:hypothetical protein